MGIRSEVVQEGTKAGWSFGSQAGAVRVDAALGDNEEVTGQGSWVISGGRRFEAIGVERFVTPGLEATRSRVASHR